MSEPQIPKQHKALVYSKPGTIAIEEKMIDTPSPGPGEVLINLYILSFLPLTPFLSLLDMH